MYQLCFRSSRGTRRDPPITPTASLLKTAQDLLERGEARLAIIPLCTLLVAEIAKRSTTYQAAGWINLARALAAYDEPILACIFMHEGSKLPKLLGTSEQTEREALAQFTDSIHFANRELPRRWVRWLELRAISFRKSDLFTRALDCYAEIKLHEKGVIGGTWADMGECHEELGELSLAELCFCLGAFRTEDISLRQEFLAKADAVHSRLQAGADPGLAVERRAAERAAAPGL